MKTGPTPGRRIWPPWLCPESIRSIPASTARAELVGRVTQEEPEIGLRGRVEIESRPQGVEVPPERQGETLNLELSPRAFDIDEPRGFEPLLDFCRVMVEVVIAQDRIRSQPPAQSPT